MSSILITGATGNIGVEVIRFLLTAGGPHRIIAGVRNIEMAKHVFAGYPALEYVHFDFDHQDTFEGALTGIDRVFLLRPPHISDVGKYFSPLISAFQQKGIREIVFLSVQGAEKSRVIPHNKIERLIIQSGLEYIFLRPGYFMQNLTTTLMPDIRTKREIILPAGHAKFNWIDIVNIGEAAAILLNKFSTYKNQAYEITGLENETFADVTAIINSIIDQPIHYRDVSLLRFFRIKNQAGMAKGMIIVMMLLHYLPRFQHEPPVSDVYQKLTGKEPTTLKAFIEREKQKFM